MKFGKILLPLLCLALVAGTASAKVVNGWLYEIPKTTVVPVIDGQLDAVWKTLDWNFQTSYVNGTLLPDDWSDLFGAHKLMYDDDNLYGIFFAQDDNIVDVHANTWERDAVEFYTDADNSKGATAYDGVNDQHINFRHEWVDNEAANVVNMGWLTGTNTAGVEFKILDDGNFGGFWVEFKIPLDALAIPPVAGTLIGVEWQQNDNDGALRESISKWWLQSGDNSWLYPALFGTAILADRVVGENFIINKLPAGTSITIDGELDAIFTSANSITQNSYSNGTMYPANYGDNFNHTYVVYDDDNLYGYFDVYDDNIVDVHANSWERDAVELYTDADNSKGATAYDGVNDQHINFRHEWIGNEAANVVNMGFLASSNTTGVELLIVDSDLGYRIEWKIPLDALSIPPVPGTVIGFEIQTNDNDGASRESITKWWLESGDNSWLYPALFGTAELGGEVVVGVDDRPTPVVNRFDLAQNYPNPFNPNTKISYTLKSNGPVRLSVYDLTGREVAVLVQGVQTAGPHEVLFSGSDLSSGVYLYRLQTANEVFTKKMALMR